MMYEKRKKTGKIVMIILFAVSTAMLILVGNFMGSNGEYKVTVQSNNGTLNAK